MDSEERKETKLGGCLLQAQIQFPRKDVVVCVLCPNKSNDIGDLGKRCVAGK
jgi:hypothetical protein